MLKLLDFDPMFFDEEPCISIINISSDGAGLVKSAAADERIQDFARDIKPEPGKIYIHILAMGSGEYFGANRNGDYFPEENLKKYHQTFSTSPAHIFKHHVNKDPNIAIGKVIFSVYNERMHRVEVIAWVDRDKGWDYVQKIERGTFPATSMACHTPFDTCSVCGNQARSRQEYCEHLKTQLGRTLPNGVKVMAINDGPLKFFDMSFVFKPADVTSSVMQKVAFERTNAPVLGSVENAEIQGLIEKASQIKKLSELIKEVEGQVVGSSDSMNAILDRVKDPDDEVIDTLVKFDLHHVIHALAELGISPSIGFFAKLIGQKLAGSSVDGIEHLVSGLIKEDASKLEVPELNMEKGASDFQIKFASEALSPFVQGSSLLPHHVLDRSLGGAIILPSNGMGYMGNGPTPIEDPRNTYKFLKEQTQEPGLLKTLFLIGGAAVAAKWLLSKMIESKMQAHIDKMDNKPVKIVLVKSASEAITTTKLVKAAFIRDLRI